MTNQEFVECWNAFTSAIDTDPATSRTAFEKLIVEFSPKLERRAKSNFLRGGDTSIAEDLIQEAFIKLYTKVINSPSRHNVIRTVQYNVMLDILYKTMFHDWLKSTKSKNHIKTGIDSEEYDQIVSDEDDRLEKKLDRKQYFSEKLLLKLAQSNSFCFELLIRVIVKRESYEHLLQLQLFNDRYKDVRSLKQKKYECVQFFKKLFTREYKYTN